VLHRAIHRREDIDSVGGLVADLSDDDVTVGTSVIWDGLRFEVTAFEDGRTTRVIVTRSGPSAAPK
jgi:CBS domain containing-hemolysin-like protein